MRLEPVSASSRERSNYVGAMNSSILLHQSKGPVFHWCWLKSNTIPWKQTGQWWCKLDTSLKAAEPSLGKNTLRKQGGAEITMLLNTHTKSTSHALQWCYCRCFWPHMSCKEESWHHSYLQRAHSNAVVFPQAHALGEWGWCIIHYCLVFSWHPPQSNWPNTASP